MQRFGDGAYFRLALNILSHDGYGCLVVVVVVCLSLSSAVVVGIYIIIIMDHHY